MVPAVCKVLRQSLLLILLFTVSVYVFDASALLVYDRQSLLQIKASYELFLNRSKNEHSNAPPPLQAPVPAFLQRAPCVIPRRKRPRRRRKRAGVLVRVRACQRFLRMDMDRVGPKFLILIWFQRSAVRALCAGYG